MPHLVNLISCSIIEKDCNGDVLWTWSYPTVTEAQKLYVARKWNSSAKQNTVQSFVGARHADVWIYIHSSEAFAAGKLPGVKSLPCLENSIETDSMDKKHIHSDKWAIGQSDQLNGFYRVLWSSMGLSKQVKRCALVLFAKDFNPHDYQELCRILSNAYCESGDPTEVLKQYLFAFSEGACNTRDSKGTTIQQFNAEWRMNNVHAKRLIRTFELETILIYTALLLKKRIVVYHHSLEELFGWIETLPTLMKHRKVTDNLFPWIDLIPEELAEIKTYGHYVAGCRDSTIASKPELFDLLVNIPAREITVAPHAKESLTMTKAHKEIALFMVQLCENDDDGKASIITEIAEKTQELLNQLKNLATVESPEGIKMLTVKNIRERDLPPAVENFLINLGVAENLFVI